MKYRPRLYECWLRWEDAPNLLATYFFRLGQPDAYGIVHCVGGLKGLSL